VTIIVFYKLIGTKFDKRSKGFFIEDINKRLKKSK